MNVKRLQCALLVFLVGVLVLTFFQSQTRGDIRAVVLNGQPAPGFTGGRFSGFNEVSVNASGDMAFYAGVFIGNLQSAGIFAILDGVLTPIALEGQLLPDGSGRNFGGAFGPAQINDNGDIIFSANFTGPISRGIFKYSGGILAIVVDESTLVPGVPGATFNWTPPFAPVQINNNGEIAFTANFIPPSFSGGPTPTGIFTVSQGVVQTVYTTAGFNLSFSLNNNGDVAFSVPNTGISLYSGGTTIQVFGANQAVPNSSLVVPPTASPVMNDAKDIVFLTYGLGCCSGRGGLTTVPNGIARWRAGVLEKIVAAGDAVPGFSGAVFDTGFGQPAVNVSGIAFTGSTAAANGLPATALIAAVRNGQLIVAAKQTDIVPGLGTLTNIFPGSTVFDDRTGPTITFQSDASFASGMFAATPALSDLQFPQIANGTGASGGWVTTILLANQSTTASSATVKFYDSNGAPMNVSINGQQMSQTSISVPALGVAQFQTDGTGSLAAGWADVQSDQSLSGTALFGFLSTSGSFASQVGAPAGTPLRALSVFAQAGSGMSTGVALANPNPAAANVTLTLVDSKANSVAVTSVSIPANGHLSEYIGEMFPALSLGSFEGKLNIVSTQPLIGLTLLQQQALFTSLPIIP